MNKKLNSALKFLAIILCLTSFSFVANAQKKKPATKKTSPKTTTVSTVSTNSLDIKSGKDKVSIQIKNISKFVYLLGGIARAIEDLDNEAKTRKISQAALDANNTNKQKVIQGIRNIRAGIIALEEEFRTKPGLRLYSVRVDGISNSVADAENQAAAGQITAAGNTLLSVIERLTDALAALP
jgi:hypothetical protein